MWQDNKPVKVLSTNARPDMTFPIERKHGNATLNIDQPENVFLYKYMNGVNEQDHLHMKYNIGRFSVKAWKYLLWFFLNSCVVSAYILYSKTNKANQKIL